MTRPQQNGAGEEVWPGPNYIYESAFAMGLLGAALLLVGMRSANEVSATWLGFWAGTFAIRYGIPTAIIAWNAVEIAGRWHLFTEFWEKPQEFWLEMSLVTAGVVIAGLLAARTSAHKKAELSRESLALAKTAGTPQTLRAGQSCPARARRCPRTR